MAVSSDAVDDAEPTNSMLAPLLITQLSIKLQPVTESIEASGKSPIPGRNIG